MPNGCKKHREYKEGCFACKLRNLTFITPLNFRSVPKGDNPDSMETYDYLRKGSTNLHRKPGYKGD